MSKSSLQPGTSLGILVGLVFGLVAASLVALYLANTGAPIQTRAQNPSVKIKIGYLITIMIRYIEWKI